MTAPVGFVGLGQIGAPMATQLLAWPGGLWVHDVAPDAVRDAVADGAIEADSLAQMASACDVVCVMVRDDDQVRSVLDGLLEGARAGMVIAVHSTIAPGTPAELADTASAKRVHVIDAPVGGGAIGAHQGRLAIMVGGTDEAVGLARPVLDLMAEMVLHLGPIGAGTRAKLARNLMHFVAFTAASEAQRLAEAAGIDIVELGRIVRHTDSVTGGPGAIMHRDTAAPLTPGDPWVKIFQHVRALGEKDLGFAIELAEQLGVETPLARLALDGFGVGLGLPADGTFTTGADDE